eukprot:9740409-Alexandrium_andersonii.AAC.1
MPAIGLTTIAIAFGLIVCEAVPGERGREAFQVWEPEEETPNKARRDPSSAPPGILLKSALKRVGHEQRQRM